MSRWEIGQLAEVLAPQDTRPGEPYWLPAVWLRHEEGGAAWFVTDGTDLWLWGLSESQVKLQRRVPRDAIVLNRDPCYRSGWIRSAANNARHRGESILSETLEAVADALDAVDLNLEMRKCMSDTTEPTFEWATRLPNGKACEWPDEASARNAFEISKRFPDGVHPVLRREFGRWVDFTDPKQCDGECHERGEDNCVRCCSGDERMCHSCLSYGAEDAEVSV